MGPWSKSEGLLLKEGGAGGTGSMLSSVIFYVILAGKREFFLSNYLLIRFLQLVLQISVDLTLIINLSLNSNQIISYHPTTC